MSRLEKEILFTVLFVTVVPLVAMWVGLSHMAKHDRERYHKADLKCSQGVYRSNYCQCMYDEGQASRSYKSYYHLKDRLLDKKPIRRCRWHYDEERWYGPK
jgi:hypothetical protein